MKSKITLGKNCVSGFFSVNDGDIYTLPDGTAAADNATERRLNAIFNLN